uniref:Uncharacterized protein n=1 Tax=Anopheles atroparvus TaxID=41427 RepID=A0A182IWB4_ANOAO
MFASPAGGDPRAPETTYFTCAHIKEFLCLLLDTLLISVAMLLLPLSLRLLLLLHLYLGLQMMLLLGLCLRLLLLQLLLLLLLLLPSPCLSAPYDIAEKVLEKTLSQPDDKGHVGLDVSEKLCTSVVSGVDVIPVLQSSGI